MCFLWGTDCICVFRMVLKLHSRTRLLQHFGRQTRPPVSHSSQINTNWLPASILMNSASFYLDLMIRSLYLTSILKIGSSFYFDSLICSQYPPPHPKLWGGSTQGQVIRHRTPAKDHRLPGEGVGRVPFRPQWVTMIFKNFQLLFSTIFNDFQGQTFAPSSMSIFPIYTERHI
jgi:hypothetical protein